MSTAKAPDVEFDPKNATESLVGDRGVFKGVIVAATAGFKPPNTTKGGIDIKAAYVLGYSVRVLDKKDWKPQPIWITYADDQGRAVKQKGSGWMNTIAMLHKTGAWGDISTQGANNDERMDNFAKSMIGMQFDFRDFVDYPRELSIEEYMELENAKKEIPRKPSSTTKRLTLPIKYYGKVAVTPEMGQGAQISTSTVTEPDFSG